MRPGPPSTLQTWRLDTPAGSFLIKRLWDGDAPAWYPSLAAAMDFERRAGAAGISMPRPVPPQRSDWGLAVELPGAGVFRAYEWLEHRSLTDTDDAAAWLGRTLAEIHRLMPVPDATEPDWYGIYPRPVWTDLIDRAESLGRPWAVIARTRIEAVTDLTEKIRTAFRRAGDPVRTHSDIEPWNVLMTARGPVLIDWDTGGIDSATLQAAQAALAFAGGDLARAAAILVEYRAAGGVITDLGPDLLIRRAGLRLCRLYFAIEAALQSPDDTAGTRIADRFETLPEFVESLSRQAVELAAMIGDGARDAQRRQL